jgi:hypothetical protein
MSDIPYSVRGSNTSINKVRGFNIAALDNDEMFKKVDANNLGSTNLYSTGTTYTNLITTRIGTGIVKTDIAFIESHQDGAIKKLYLNTANDREKGITITSDGRVGIGITDPDHSLDVEGHIRLRSSGADRLIFNNTTTGDLADVDAIVDGTNGGAWGVRTKVDGVSSLTEKLRINNVGAFGIGGANYGNTGAFLISNGSSLAPIWQEKYFIQAYLPSSFGFSGSGSFSGINNWSVQYSSTGASSDMGVQYWTCPQTGIYRISGYLSYLISGNQDIIQQAHLLVTDSANTVNYIGIQQNNGSDDDDARITLSFDRMIEFTQNLGFYFNVMMITNGASGSTYYIQNSFGSGLSIERIK